MQESPNTREAMNLLDSFTIYSNSEKWGSKLDAGEAGRMGGSVRKPSMDP